MAFAEEYLTTTTYLLKETTMFKNGNISKYEFNKSIMVNLAYLLKLTDLNNQNVKEEIEESIEKGWALLPPNTNNANNANNANNDKNANNNVDQDNNMKPDTNNKDVQSSSNNKNVKSSSNNKNISDKNINSDNKNVNLENNNKSNSSNNIMKSNSNNKNNNENIIKEIEKRKDFESDSLNKPRSRKIIINKGTNKFIDMYIPILQLSFQMEDQFPIEKWQYKNYYKDNIKLIKNDDEFEKTEQREQSSLFHLKFEENPIIIDENKNDLLTTSSLLDSSLEPEETKSFPFLHNLAVKTPNSSGSTEDDSLNVSIIQRSLLTSSSKKSLDDSQIELDNDLFYVLPEIPIETSVNDSEENSIQPTTSNIIRYRQNFVETHDKFKNIPVKEDYKSEIYNYKKQTGKMKYINDKDELECYLPQREASVYLKEMNANYIRYMYFQFMKMKQQCVMIETFEEKMFMNMIKIFILEIGLSDRKTYEDTLRKLVYKQICNSFSLFIFSFFRILKLKDEYTVIKYKFLLYITKLGNEREFNKNHFKKFFELIQCKLVYDEELFNDITENLISRYESFYPGENYVVFPVEKVMLVLESFFDNK